MDIARGIRRSRLRPYSWHTLENRSFLPHFVEETGACKVRTVTGSLEFAIAPRCRKWSIRYPAVSSQKHTRLPLHGLRLKTSQYKYGRELTLCLPVWNSFPIEMSQRFYELRILQQTQATSLSAPHQDSSLVVCERTSFSIQSLNNLFGNYRRIFTFCWCVVFVPYHGGENW